MKIATLARHGLGKLLVAIGLLGLIALAFATPLAFTAQTGTILELLLLAVLGGALCFALLLVGDWIARPQVSERLGSSTRRLRTGRPAGARRLTSDTPSRSVRPAVAPPALGSTSMN